MTNEIEHELIQSLKMLMAEKKINSFRELAEKLGVSPSTLSRNIRNLARTQNYLAKLPTELARLFDIDIEELKEELADKKRVDRMGVFKHAQILSTNIIRALEPYFTNIKDLIDKLSEDDTYIFMTSDPPQEYSDADFLEVVAEAIKRGVKFQYLFPNPSTKNIVFRQLYEQYYHDSIDDPWKRLPEMHKKLLKKLVEDYGVSKKQVESHVTCVLCDDPLLMNPLYKIALVENNLIDRVEYTAFIEHKMLQPGSVEGHRLWYPLARIETNRIVRTITNLCDLGACLEVMREAEKEENKLVGNLRRKGLREKSEKLIQVE
jgi:transcriptional regulator with XRE-family HTH domain